ncbi:MAG: hypothetical protein ACREO4_08840, partial [Lysobacter sp.]
MRSRGRDIQRDNLVLRPLAYNQQAVTDRLDATAELTGRMMGVNPKVGDLTDLNRAIEIQMRKAKIYGTPVSGTGRFRYLIMADPRV